MTCSKHGILCLWKRQSQYNLLCKIDISTENKMNIQLWVTSLFGSARQNVAICGHNVSAIHCVRVLSILWPRFLEGALHSCYSSHTSCSGTTLLLLFSRACLSLQDPRVPGWDVNWVGMRGMQIRVREGRECHKLNKEIEESGAWLAWPLNHDHSSISRGQRGLCSFVINAYCPCVDKSLKMTHQQQHSDLSLCPLHRSWLLGLVGHNVFSRFVSHLFWSHSCGKWRLRVTHLQVRDEQIAWSTSLSWICCPALLWGETRTIAKKKIRNLIYLMLQDHR